jgi:hypothetical protein
VLHPDDKHCVLMSSTKCQRRNTHRKNPLTGMKELYTPACGGRCGKYHALSVDRIASDTENCLELAGVDTSEFKSHQPRGNAEAVIVYSPRFSDEFASSESMVRRARC